jgi:hypothetical protein
MGIVIPFPKVHKLTQEVTCVSEFIDGLYQFEMNRQVDVPPSEWILDVEAFLNEPK